VWDTEQSRTGHADVALVPLKPVTGISAVRGDLPFHKGANAADADGTILFGEAWTAYGYDSPIVTVTMTGTQILLALEQQWRETAGAEVHTPLAVSSGLRYRFDLGRPVGSRVPVETVTIRGRALDPSRSYRVAANSYSILGQDGFPALTVFTDPVRHTLDKEGFIRFLRGRTITPPALDRAQPVSTG
jgi:5'-nucleotidase